MAERRDRRIGDAMAKKPEVWAREGSQHVGDYGIFRVRRDAVRSPRTGALLDRHVLEMQDWVNVVPVTEDGRAVLVEQFRFGTREVTLEFPAGIIEPGEDPCVAGTREVVEETGYRPEQCVHLAELDPNPALQDNRLHVVLATGCRWTGEQAQDEGEDIHVRVATIEEVDRWVAEGRIRHALAVVTWCMWKLAGAGAVGVR